MCVPATAFILGRILDAQQSVLLAQSPRNWGPARTWKHCACANMNSKLNAISEVSIWLTVDYAHRCRYISKVEDAVRLMLEGKLSKEKFPYINRESKVEEDEEEEPEDGVCVPVCVYVCVLSFTIFIAGEGDEKPSAGRVAALSARTRRRAPGGDAASGTPPSSAAASAFAAKLAKYRRFVSCLVVDVLCTIRAIFAFVCLRCLLCRRVASLCLSLAA